MKLPLGGRQRGFLSHGAHLLQLLGGLLVAILGIWHGGQALITLWGEEPLYAIGLLWLVASLVAYQFRFRVLGRPRS